MVRSCGAVGARRWWRTTPPPPEGDPPVRRGCGIGPADRAPPYRGCAVCAVRRWGARTPRMRAMRGSGRSGGVMSGDAGSSSMGRSNDQKARAPTRPAPNSGSELGLWGARGRIRTDDLPITRRMLGVDLVGSRRIWPAHVGCLVDPVGSRRVQSDRLDDQTDDQGPSEESNDKPSR